MQTLRAQTDELADALAAYLSTVENPEDPAALFLATLARNTVVLTDVVTSLLAE